MTQANRIVLASRPEGKPSTDNFRHETVDLPAPKDGEMLVRVIWLSLDPYMRGRMDDAKSYAEPVEIGETMEGGAVAEVMESKNGTFKVGQIVTGQFGWCSHAISDGTDVRVIDPDQAPISTALGVLGMPGITAWVGLNDIGRAKDNETIVVSAATGAVGGVVGQLAKARNMTVIGVAGGPEKCDFAVKELGYDICLDHHAHDAKSLSAAIKEAAPGGVDVYFESVGGKTLEAVLSRMNGDVVLDPFFGTGTTGAVGKMLGRDFIGIEREESYRAHAEKRLEKVRKFDREALEVTQSKRAEPRVAFGVLVERGMLRPGEELWSLNGRHKAKVRADGTLIGDDIKGSIHQVGAHLEGAPSCNGWTYWQFRRDGQRVPIDVLRQQIRAEMAASA